MLNKSDIQNFIYNFQAAWSIQNVDGVLEFFAEDLSFEDIPIGLHANDKDELKEILDITFGSVPNFKMEIFEHHVGDDFLSTKWKQSGNMTVQGYGLDLKDFAYEVITTSIIKFNESGKIISVSDNWNAGVFYQ